MSESLKMQFLCLTLSWCRSNCSVLVALAFFLCNVNLDFSEAQLSTVATTTAKGTLTTVRKIDCNLTTQCFLDENQLDPLVNCTFALFGETHPPCYGHWTSAFDCSCDDPMHRISSHGATYWCTDSGTWDNTIYDLQCQAPCITDADENAIPRNSNGSVSTTILHGDVVTYTCPEGYIGSGTQTVDCNDGVWEPHEQFTCTDGVATIPTTLIEYGTSDAEDILGSNEPTTVTAASTILSSETFPSSTKLKNATTSDGTTRSMEATTSKNVSVPSVDTTTSIYGTTEKTTAEYATSGSKILTNVVTLRDRLDVIAYTMKTTQILTKTY